MVFENEQGGEYLNTAEGAQLRDCCHGKAEPRKGACQLASPFRLGTLLLFGSGVNLIQYFDLTLLSGIWSRLCRFWGRIEGTWNVAPALKRESNLKRALQ